MLVVARLLSHCCLRRGQFSTIWIAAVLLCAASIASADEALTFRPPAVPLIAHDPYFSVWSMTDRLTDGPTRHWTGTEQQLAGLVRIDGSPYRFLGSEPGEIPAMAQQSVTVTPTRTLYRFAAAGIELDLTFLTPALPADLDVLSRPVTYLVFDIRATDGRPHRIALYADAASQLAVNAPDQPVTWSHDRAGNLDVVRVGTVEQPVLAESGDNLRIDWGWLYLAVPREGRGTAFATDRSARAAFARSGAVPMADDPGMPRRPDRDMPVLGAAFDLGAVGSDTVSRHLLVAYDDLFSVEYMHQRLRPWWRRNGMSARQLLQVAADDYGGLADRSRRFDERLTADLVRAGGAPYAALAALAYRQTLAAHKLVAGADGTPLYFSKENFSNGSMDTVDVTYPSSPFFLLLNPELLKAQLVPVLDYAASPRWPWPFAPHDLGTYPLANGQTYGGGEKSETDQMPVEESGNLIILVAALTRAEGDAGFASRYRPLLARWAAYLRAKGMDPENQLSTDDFAGHLAHNANLSIKAILALGAFADLAESLGSKDEAAAYRRVAAEMVPEWLRRADDGDHYRLAFDKPGTWSQKYNLVWDRLLGLNLFPAGVARKEIDFYKTRQNGYGLPLDSRASYTKLDWIAWTASLTGDMEDFTTFILPVFRWANETSARVPLTDWYDTIDGRQRGFQARSVVGGLYMKMLMDSRRLQRPAAAGSGGPSVGPPLPGEQ